MKAFWHDNFDSTEMPVWINYVGSIPSDKSLLWIDYKRVPAVSMVEYTVAVLQRKIQEGITFDKLVLTYPSEAPDWQDCINVAIAFGCDDIATVDAGLDSKVDARSHFSSHKKIRCRHFADPFFLNCYHSSWEKNDKLEPEKREKKLAYLARIARPHRISMAVELLERGLTQDSVISCGWVYWNYAVFSKYIPKQYRNLFPISLKEENYIENDNIIKTWGVNSQISSSVFNLIAESAFDFSFVDKQNNTYWSRNLITEKTIKTYFLHQFPIWLAPMGAVEEQRQLGFDVFDDIIDHTYDEEYRPHHRLELVAKEVERLYNSYSLDDMQKLLKEKWTRLESNLHNYKSLRYEKYRDEFIDWASK